MRSCFQSLARAMEFPTVQAPLAESFDPSADLMVSDMKVMREQMTGEASFRFARLGTIVKMTLTGLDDYAGCTADEIFLTVGESFNIPKRIIYDPVLNKYVPAMDKEARSDEGSGMPSELRIMGENIVINEDGTADVWLRLPSGELTDWFRLDLVLSDDTDDYYLARFIDLTQHRRTLTFEEGGMTTFSVGGFGVADVEPVGDIDYTANDDMDGFTATWNAVKHATGYECHIESPDDARIDLAVTESSGICSVSVENGMMKGSYYIYVRPTPAEGHELSSSEYTYEEILIGIPFKNYFAHDSFDTDKDEDEKKMSEKVEDIDNEYIIPVYSPGKVRYKNLVRQYQSSWQALVANGEWFMYSTEPLKMHSIELWSKDDSHQSFDVYASNGPGEESLKLEGVVIKVSDIDEGSGQYRYDHVHKLVQYTFPENGDYKYYTIKGSSAGTVMTNQFTYVYYYK